MYRFPSLAAIDKLDSLHLVSSNNLSYYSQNFQRLDRESVWRKRQKLNIQALASLETVRSGKSLHAPVYEKSPNRTFITYLSEWVSFGALWDFIPGPPYGGSVPEPFSGGLCPRSPARGAAPGLRLGARRPQDPSWLLSPKKCPPERVPAGILLRTWAMSNSAGYRCQ